MRAVFWVLAVLMGGAQTWYTRHRIFADGTSYLEIAERYAHGDWHGALNAYWSPLYSWILGAYLVVLRPSPYWEAFALHVVNYLAFLASCWIFEKVLTEVTRARPAGLAGFSPGTVKAAGYVAILHGGILMVGTGAVSPDMVAYFLTGLAACLTLRIARGGAQWLTCAALGATLGLGYLDRAAFAPLNAVYLLAVGILLVRNWRPMLLCCFCYALVAGPFVAALSLQRGSLTLGEAGKLNYGWEVAGARRSTYWEGEPGDLGRPAHPARLVLKTPVPVFEFAGPVPGSYPVWRDPSYWYEGIQPIVKWQEQFRVFAMNLRTMALYLATTPAFLIWMLVLAAGGVMGFGIRKWPRVYWAVLLPALAGVALYLIVFMDKRYVAGFFTVIGIALVAGIELPRGRLARFGNFAAQGVAFIGLLTIGIWMRPAFAMSFRDAVAGHEGELSESWMIADRLRQLGVKPGDGVAYVGNGMSADWVRVEKARIVAEVPVVWERGSRLFNTVEENDANPTKFFELDEASREPVYEAFRRTGATIAVAARIPAGGHAGDWRPVLDPREKGYPSSSGQLLQQIPAYYRWLNR